MHDHFDEFMKAVKSPSRALLVVHRAVFMFWPFGAILVFTCVMIVWGILYSFGLCHGIKNARVRCFSPAGRLPSSCLEVFDQTEKPMRFAGAFLHAFGAAPLRATFNLV